MCAYSCESALEPHLKTLLKLWRGTANCSPLSERELRQVSGALLKLQRGLTGERNLAGAGYMEDRAFLGAYLLYYWPVSFMQVSYAFCNVLKSGRLDFFKNLPRPVRILDAGSGPGPAAASVCSALGTSALGKSAGIASNNIELTLCDYSARSLSLAKRLFESDFKQIDTQTVTADFMKKDPAGLFKGKYDIIVTSHALNELWKDFPDRISRRTNFLKSLLNLLSPGGVLLVCEPALLETSRSLIEARDTLVREGAAVVSPCVASCICPALKASSATTCHSEVLWTPPHTVAALARSAGLERTSVKMSYFAFVNEEDNVPCGCTGEYAVVSDGMLNKSGRVRYLLCDGRSRIPLSAKKDDTHAKELGFFNLRRYDRIALLNPELRGDKDSPAFGIGEKTALKVEPFASSNTKIAP